MAKKSSLKKARQAKERNARNKRVKRTFKTAIKKLDLALKEKKDKQELNALMNRATALIDKAAAKRVLHKNTAARKKSLLSRKLKNQLSE